MNDPITWNSVIFVYLAYCLIALVGSFVFSLIVYIVLKCGKPKQVIRSDGDNLDGDDEEIERWNV